MKYCPHCGAVLQDGAFSFCPDCGKELTSAETSNEKDSRKKKRAKKNGKRPPAATPPPVEEVESAKEDYDGYYDDVAPLDAGKAGEGIDKELMKKVVGMICGLLVVIGACVALMYFL